MIKARIHEEIPARRSVEARPRPSTSIGGCIKAWTEHEEGHWCSNHMGAPHNEFLNLNYPEAHECRHKKHPGWRDCVMKQPKGLKNRLAVNRLLTNDEPGSMRDHDNKCPWWCQTPHVAQRGALEVQECLTWCNRRMQPKSLTWNTKVRQLEAHNITRQRKVLHLQECPQDSTRNKPDMSTRPSLLQESMDVLTRLSTAIRKGHMPLMGVFNWLEIAIFCALVTSKCNCNCSWFWHCYWNELNFYCFCMHFLNNHPDKLVATDPHWIAIQSKVLNTCMTVLENQHHALGTCAHMRRKVSRSDVRIFRHHTNHPSPLVCRTYSYFQHV